MQSKKIPEFLWPKQSVVNFLIGNGLADITKNQYLFAEMIEWIYCIISSGQKSLSKVLDEDTRYSFTKVSIVKSNIHCSNAAYAENFFRYRKIWKKNQFEKIYFILKIFCMFWTLHMVKENNGSI